MTTEYTGRSVNIEPDWEGLVLWEAEAFAYHAFENGAREPITVFIDHIRFLERTDPQVLDRIVKRLERR